MRFPRQWTSFDSQPYSVYANSVTEHETSCRNTNLLVQQIQGQLEAHGLHVSPLEGGGDVHVHVQEPEGHHSSIIVSGNNSQPWTDLLMAPPCSACSISSCDRSLTNHSKLFWSRLIQKKSTCGGEQEIDNYPANSPPLSHLLQVEHVGGDVIAPLIVTLGTLLLDLPVPDIRQ